jgi:mannose-6-phosphate isomerase-like protein (cupin superfamily)
MKAEIRRHAPDEEYYFKEGCFITELSNTDNDTQASIARARLQPGKTTRWHRLHDTAERYVILEGRGCVEIGDCPPTDVGAGDIVLIPPLCRQRITSTGSADLVFLAICTPRFMHQNYEDIDDDPREGVTAGE